MTDSIRKMMEETNRRRAKQITYNAEHNITPTQIVKSTRDIMGQTAVADSKGKGPVGYVERDLYEIAADPVAQYLPKDKLQKLIAKSRKAMEEAERLDAPPKPHSHLKKIRTGTLLIVVDQ